MSRGRLDHLAQAWEAMLARGETPFDLRITWKLRSLALVIIATAGTGFLLGFILGGRG